MGVGANISVLQWPAQNGAACVETGWPIRRVALLQGPHTGTCASICLLPRSARDGNRTGGCPPFSQVLLLTTPLAACPTVRASHLLSRVGLGCCGAEHRCTAWMDRAGSDRARPRWLAAERHARLLPCACAVQCGRLRGGGIRHDGAACRRVGACPCRWGGYVLAGTGCGACRAHRGRTHVRGRQ